MLIDDIVRYLALRRSLGFKLEGPEVHLRAFAAFVEGRGDTHILAVTALDWASGASSVGARYARLRDVILLAQFLQAEDPAHEVPRNPFPCRSKRPAPYIYSPDEILRLLDATARLLETWPLRRQVYRTLLGLIAATGLRASEALNLQFDDLSKDGVLRVKDTKFGKTRLIPLHPTTFAALRRYLVLRRRVATTDPHIFISAKHQRIHISSFEATFQEVRRLADIAPDRARRPRVHDLRHTWATRALMRCSGDRLAISRHFIALSTYLGHVNVHSTFWYLEATPELMADMAEAAEALAVRGPR